VKKYAFDIVKYEKEPLQNPQDVLAARPFINPDNKLTRDASKFYPGAELDLAINTAIAVGEPLLITGEPGTGKTQTAYYTAHKLGLSKVFHFQVKSDSTAHDLLYEFDSVRYFREAQLAEDIDQLDKMRFVDRRTLYLAIEASNKSGLPSVVLIDEIDKAPRDFPNDLLHEIDHMEFKIIELEDAEPIKVKDKALRPLVFITSNSERRLPEPFLRRCVYHHIQFNEDILEQAWKARKQDFPGLSEDLARLAIQRFIDLRKKDLRKYPATGEFLVWLKLLAIYANKKPGELEDKLREAESNLAELPYLKSVLLKDHKDGEEIG